MKMSEKYLRSEKINSVLDKHGKDLIIIYVTKKTNKMDIHFMMLIFYIEFKLLNVYI